MPSSNALIRWNPHPNTEVAMPESSRPRGGRWDLILRALLSPSPGRTLDRVYTSLGDVLQTHANRTAHTLGLGPRVVARNIKSYFGNAEERVQRLERLRIVVPPKLKKNCLKLMKHTLPKEAANTQCQAFKEIVDLVTLLPGLRVLFLQTKVLDNATVLTINSVWDRPAGAPDKDWSFWQILAATCLTDTRISIILEGSSIADLSHCRPEILSVIEKLLIEHDCCGSSEYSSALCIRYLAGVLDLREFWLDLGSIHAYVANKLFRLGAQVLNDIGADIPALGVIAEPEAAFDYDGVDFLAQTLLEGLSGWFAKIDPEQWYAQPWYESFTIFLQLLRRPRAAEILPQSSNCATNTFEDILPTVRRNTAIHVMVDGRDSIAADVHTPQENHLTYLECETTHTVQSDSSESLPCLDHAARQNFNGVSPELPTEDCSTSCSRRSDICDAEAMHIEVTARDTLIEFEERPELDFDYHSEVLLDSNAEPVEMHRFTSDEGSLNWSPYSNSPLEARRHEILEELRMILHQRQRDFGGNHPDTLEAMENLARTHDELGEFRSARDLREVVVEKTRIVLGTDHPATLHAMNALGSTYFILGQYKMGQELILSALEKQRQVLGDNHPDTLNTKTCLVVTYQRLRQWREAERLEMAVLAREREALGESHPDTLTTMGNLVSAYQYLGQLDKAQELGIFVLDKRRQLLGEDHPQTLLSMGTMVMIFQSLGRLAEAENLQRVVLEKETKFLEENLPVTLHTMLELGSTYTDLGQLEKAESLLGAALGRQTELTGKDHPQTVRTMRCLAATYGQLRRFGIAEGFSTAVLQKQRRSVGEDHPEALWTMGDLAWICQMQGRFEHAEHLYVGILEKWRKLLGDHHQDTRWVIGNLMSTYRSLNKLQAAEELGRLIEGVEHCITHRDS